MNHNQLLECCQNEMGSEHPIFVNEKELGPVSEVTNMQYITTKIRDFLGIDSIQHVVKVRWLTVNGNKYSSEKSLIITDANETVPVFGLIKNIYVVNSLLYCFEYQIYETLCFNKDLLVYEVAVPDLAQATELIEAEKLLDHTSYDSINFTNSGFVPMKYNLEDVLALRK